MKAADTIFGRFCDLFPPDRVPDPSRLVTMDADAIRAVGFSRPKAGFLKDLAAHVVDRRVCRSRRCTTLSDDEVMAALTAVKGDRPVDGGGVPDLPPRPAGRLSRPTIWGWSKRCSSVYGLAKTAVARAAAEDGGTLAAVSIGRGVVSVAKPLDA